ncbi:MAG: protein-tyrosine phosphatase [Halioglobus sp.]|jgi:protein-tyrosine phosphatase
MISKILDWRGLLSKVDWRRFFQAGVGMLEPRTQVLFVCRENICRSPMAEGVLRARLEREGLAGRVEVRSAGTQTTQPGRRPDQRSERAARIAGIDLSKQRAHLVTDDDLARADLVLAMDESNVEDLLAICPARHQHKIHLLLSFTPGQALAEVPDPYYGSTEGFENVFQVIDGAVANLVPHVHDLL